MRLLRLELPDFKNLRKFAIDFDAASPVAVLVGRNGTGKSNILEAVTLIFRDLDLGQPASLDYSIDYVCRGHAISIVGKEGNRAVQATVDGEKVATNKIAGEGGREFRPDFVFGYYSGPTNRLEEHYIPHQERFYRDLVNGIENPLRPLFYARSVHSNFVLLAFFLEEDPDVRTFLSDHLSIETLDSVLFEMQKPPWPSRSGDPRFWNARGTVQLLLDRLYAESLAPMRMKRSIPVPMRRPVQTEHLYLYLPGIEEIKNVRMAYRSDQEFFKALESTYISELIYDVRIRVGLRRAKESLTFRELSEGEQQLLLVLGLMRFTREDESLFLLDEPDTHLNPAWSAQYRRFLERFGGLGPSSHVLMATHDALVVSSMTRQEVRILERDERGSVKALLPLEDPRGMGVGNLLTSDVYGLRAQISDETLELIEKKRILSAKENLSEAEGEELAQLADELGDLGLLVEDRDPDFHDYLRARYRSLETLPTQESRTQGEVVADRELASEILREVLARRASGKEE